MRKIDTIANWTAISDVIPVTRKLTGITTERTRYEVDKVAEIRVKLANRRKEIKIPTRKTTNPPADTGSGNTINVHTAKTTGPVARVPQAAKLVSLVDEQTNWMRKRP